MRKLIDAMVASVRLRLRHQRNADQFTIVQ
jgi:hypothetical protein